MSTGVESQRNCSLRYLLCNLCCCCPRQAPDTSKVKSSHEVASTRMYRGGIIEEQREGHWRELFQVSPLPMALISKEGRVVVTNSIMRELFAIPREPIRAINIEDLIADPEPDMAPSLITQKFLQQFYSQISASSSSASSHPDGRLEKEEEEQHRGLAGGGAGGVRAKPLELALEQNH